MLLLLLSACTPAPRCVRRSDIPDSEAFARIRPVASCVDLPIGVDDPPPPTVVCTTREATCTRLGPPGTLNFRCVDSDGEVAYSLPGACDDGQSDPCEGRNGYCVD